MQNKNFVFNLSEHEPNKFSQTTLQEKKQHREYLNSR